VGERHPARHEPADRVVEGDGRAGQRGRPGQRHPRADDLDIQVADPTPAIAQAGHRVGVADQQQAVR
jgi:hypothetical protein